MSSPARLAIQQRVLPAYRAPLFERLAGRFASLSVFAGSPQPEEALGEPGQLRQARFTLARNRYFGQVPDCLFYQVGLLRWLAAEQPQVLILEANLRNLTIPLAVRWMRARRRPVIAWGLGVPAASALRRSAWQVFLRQFDALIAYSRRGAGEYRALGFPEEKIFLALNAAVPKPAQPPHRAPTPERPVVLFVGRLQPRKRLDLLFTACAALPPNLQPDVWIVGDGPARAEFEAQSARLYPSARFFGDRRGPDLDPLYAAADLFVLPGTGGLAVQQAMAAGLPVIVAQGDGTQDDLVRPANGWQLPPGDLPALTAALQAALSDRARLQEMGAESYRIVAEEVNLDAMVAGFERAVVSLYPTCCNY
jgi:glycosyltransferase involved in cell wall biosynthesis